MRWSLAFLALVIAGGCSCTDSASGRVYITSEGSGTMTVIDPARHEVVATVNLGKRPRGMVSSQDGNFIYVALSGSPWAPPGSGPSSGPAI